MILDTARHYAMTVSLSQTPAKLIVHFMPKSWRLVVYSNIHLHTEECAFFGCFISVMKCRVLTFCFHVAVA